MRRVELFAVYSIECIFTLWNAGGATREARACSRNRWPGEAYRLLEKESA